MKDKVEEVIIWMRRTSIWESRSGLKAMKMPIPSSRDVLFKIYGIMAKGGTASTISGGLVSRYIRREPLKIFIRYTILYSPSLKLGVLGKYTGFS